MPGTARLEDIESTTPSGRASLDDIEKPGEEEVSKAVAAVPRPTFQAPKPDLTTRAVDAVAPRPIQHAEPSGEMPGSFEGKPENIAPVGGVAVNAAGDVGRGLKKVFTSGGTPQSAGARTGPTPEPQTPEEQAEGRQVLSGSADLMRGGGTLMLPATGAAAISKPLSTALWMAAGYGAQKGTEKLVHGKVSPETEDFLTQLAMFAPQTAATLSGLHGAAIDLPEGQGAGVSAFGDRVRAGVAVTPEQVAVSGKVGPFQGRVNIPRGPQPRPALDPQTIEGEQVSSAIQNEEQQAMRVASGLPPMEPVPPPPGPPPPPKINEVGQADIAKIAKTISQVPQEHRAQALLEAHDTLGKVLLQQGKFVDPDGKIQIVDPTKPEQATKLATQFLNDEIDRQQKAAEEAATAKEQPTSKPVRKRSVAAEKPVEAVQEPVVQTAHVDDIEESAHGTNNDHLPSNAERGGVQEPAPNRAAVGEAGKPGVVQAGSEGASGTAHISEVAPKPTEAQQPRSQTKATPWKKGDRFVTKHGTEATVEYSSPSMRIVRARDAEGNKFTVSGKAVDELKQKPETEPAISPVAPPKGAGEENAQTQALTPAGAKGTHYISLSGRGAPALKVKVDYADQASQVMQAYRDKFGLGSSNMSPESGHIFTADGKQVGYISYNGRVWAGTPQTWKSGQKPLQERTPLPNESVTAPSKGAENTLTSGSWPVSESAARPAAAHVSRIEKQVGPEPGKVGEMKTSDLKLAPQKFQYKLGTDAEGVGTLLKEQSKFNPDLASVISVWKDPSDGKFYVVNGHHRYELAKRTGQKSVAVRHIKANNPEEARSIGALQNIAEGRGTPVDAAKFFRDSKLSPEDLSGKGISMGEATARKGVALSKLDTPLFNKVVSGDLSLGRAVAIGDATSDPAEQKAVFDLVNKKEARGQKISDGTLSELIRFVKGSGQQTETTSNLFGMQEINKSLALEKAEVSDYIKTQLAKDKKLFGFVSKEGRAEELARAGNKIEVEKSKEISEGAAQAEEVYNRLSGRGGELATVLDEAARQIADGKNSAAVKSEAYKRVREAIHRTLSGAEGESTRRSEEPPEGGRGSQETEKPATDQSDRSVSLFHEAPAPAFYSKAARVAFDKVPNSAPGGAILATLRNNGVKEDEIKWLGLDDFLRGKFHVAKKELMRHIMENTLQVSEVSKGQRTPEQQEAIDEAKTDHHAARETFLREFADQMQSRGIEADRAEAIRAGQLAAAEIQEGGDSVDGVIRRYLKIRGAVPDDVGLAGQTLSMAHATLHNVRSSNQSPTKYESYTLPGPKENYTELLLTLPNLKSQTKFDPAKVEIRRDQRSVTQGSTSIYYDGKHLASYGDDPTLQSDGSYKQRPESYWMGVAKDVFTAGDPRNSVQSVAGGFRSGHWDEPNILTHIRFDDRFVPADEGASSRETLSRTGENEMTSGKQKGHRVLLVEEVQSDWHQKGKKEGYVQPVDSSKWTVGKVTGESKVPPYDKWITEQPWFISGAFTDKSSTRAHELYNEYKERADSWLTKSFIVRDASGKTLGTRYAGSPEAAIKEQERIETEALNRNKVPDAPFKSDWHELAMKRMLRYAAEHGYDKLAWVTGEQTADRYNLSKHVDKIEAFRTKDQNDFTIVAHRGVAPVYKEHSIPEGRLADYVGKDLAQKIAQLKPGESGDYSGDDLKVGGHWAKSLYDRAIPNFVNKVAKKWGAKVGETKIQTHDTGVPPETDLLPQDHGIVSVHSVDITPEMKQSVVYEGQPLFKNDPYTLIRDRSPQAWATIAKDATFDAVHPTDVRPYVRLNRSALQLVGNALQRNILGGSVPPAELPEVYEGLEKLRDKIKPTDAKAAGNIDKLIEVFKSNADKTAGLTFVPSSGDSAHELRVLHEEQFHAMAQSPAHEDRGVPWQEMMGDPGVKQMEERITTETRSGEPMLIVAEAMADIAVGSDEELTSDQAYKTATRYYELVAEKHGAEPLDAAQQVYDHIDQEAQARGMIPAGAQFNAARTAAGRRALADVREKLRKGAGENNERQKVARPGSEVPEKAKPGDTEKSAARGAPADQLRPREREASPATAKGTAALGSTQPVGLTDEELQEWAQSKGFRSEPAGEQLGMFGGSEPVLRVFRLNRGKEQSGLVYQSQFDKLRQPKEEPTEPFALTGGEAPADDQPRLFGAGDLGEIIGPTGKKESLSPKTEGTGSLFHSKKTEVRDVTTSKGVHLEITRYPNYNIKGTFRYEAKNAKGGEIGYVWIGSNDDGTWSAMNASVDEAYRRKGVATALYDAAEADGMKLQPSGMGAGGKLSDDSSAFWRSRNRARVKTLLTSESGTFEPGKIKSYLDEQLKDLRGARELERGTFDLEKRHEASVLRAKQLIEAANKKYGKEGIADYEQVYHHLENPDGVELSARQDEILDKLVLPVMEKNDELYEELKKEEVPIDNYVHRQVKGKGGWFDRILAGGKGTGKGNVLSRSAPQTKGRTMMALEYVGQGDNAQRSLLHKPGERRVVSIKGGQVTGWKNGQPENLGGISHTQEGKVFEDKDGSIWNLTQATTKEIEQHTELEYYHNALASALVSNLQLAKAVDAARFVDSFKASPEFKDIAFKEGGGTPPKGWRITQLPQFKGYYFEPHYADVLDRYAQKLQTTPSALDQVGAFMRVAMLLNPIMHPLNVGASWAVDRGVTGFLPHTYMTAAKAGMRATAAVWKQNDDFLHALDEGAPLQSHRDATRKITELFFDQLGEGLRKEEPWALKVAKNIGMAPITLIKALHNFSSKVAWISNDILFLQAAYERQAHGVDFVEALHETGRTIPEYRLPAHILNSRLAGKVMESQWVTIFGSYHYGLLRSFAEAGKSALGINESPAGGNRARDVAKGWDRLALIGLVVMAMYPLLDELAKKATGDEHARAKRFGPFAVIDAWAAALEHRKTVGEAAQTSVTPAPQTKAIAELAMNREFYSGRQIYNPHDSWQTEGEQLGHYLLSQVGQIGQAVQSYPSASRWRKYKLEQVGVQLKPSRAEKVAQDIARSKTGTQAAEPGEMEKYGERHDIIDALRNGNRTPLEKAEARGDISRQQAHHMQERARRSPLEDTVYGFTYSEVMKVRDAAEKDGNQEQVHLLDRVLQRKRLNMWKRHETVTAEK